MISRRAKFCSVPSQFFEHFSSFLKLSLACVTALFVLFHFLSLALTRFNSRHCPVFSSISPPFLHLAANGVSRKLRPRKLRPQTRKTQTLGCLENSDLEKTQTLGCLENSDLENSDLRPEKLRPSECLENSDLEKTQTLGCLENSDPKNSDPWMSRKLRPEKLRPSGCLENSDPKNKTYLHRVNAVSGLVYCSLIQWH